MVVGVGAGAFDDSKKRRAAAAVEEVWRSSRFLQGDCPNAILHNTRQATDGKAYEGQTIN